MQLCIISVFHHHSCRSGISWVVVFFESGQLNVLCAECVCVGWGWGMGGGNLLVAALSPVNHKGLDQG